MAVTARAPGKLVILGEYAVLSGAPALVMAVDRYARARIEPSADRRTHLEARLGAATNVSVASGEPTGYPLVDCVVAASRTAKAVPAWTASVDSADFFAGGAKLGLGSSAAALCAWAGAWAAYCRAHGKAVPIPTAASLVELHRAFQHGAGSGLDVATAFSGGVIQYSLDEHGSPRIGSVRLPNGVGFAGVFVGSSASTPDLVGRYQAWAAAEPLAAGRLKDRLTGLAAAGCEAASAGDARTFLDAVADYGEALEALGLAMGAEIVTPEHRRIGLLGRRLGVVYKTSGAGGGDVGLALSLQPESLREFEARVAEMGFLVVGLGLDQRGLIVEESSE
jgi:phosphomevalonate kinase